jgi:Ni,Fe-hydrogenase I large subunit
METGTKRTAYQAELEEPDTKFYGYGEKSVLGKRKDRTATLSNVDSVAKKKRLTGPKVVHQNRPKVTGKRGLDSGEQSASNRFKTSDVMEIVQEVVPEIVAKVAKEKVVKEKKAKKAKKEKKEKKEKVKRAPTAYNNFVQIERANYRAENLRPIVGAGNKSRYVQKNGQPFTSADNKMVTKNIGMKWKQLQSQGLAPLPKVSDPKSKPRKTTGTLKQKWAYAKQNPDIFFKNGKWDISAITKLSV